MAAGDLVVDEYQLEIRGHLLGPGTGFTWGPEGWGGLGLPAPKTQDVDLDQADGAYAGRDYLSTRILTFPAVWGGDGASAVMRDLALLSGWWAPSVVDLELWMMLPGWERFYVFGRPRGLVEDLSNMPKGEGRALLTFVATDPTVYFAETPGS